MTFLLFPWIGKASLNRIYSEKKEFALLEQILSFEGLILIKKGVAALERVFIQMKIC